MMDDMMTGEGDTDTYPTEGYYFLALSLTLSITLSLSLSLSLSITSNP